MGHTHIKTSETLRSCNHNKIQDEDITNPVYLWMLFQPHFKKFTEVDQEWQLIHMARTQQSTIVRASDSQHCNSLGTCGPGEKKLQCTNNVKPGVEVEEDSNFYPDE